MAFEIPKINMFQQPIQQIGAVGAQGPQKVGGTQAAGGIFGGSQGGSSVDRDLADMRRFLQPNNGTGELQPNRSEANMFYMA